MADGASAMRRRPRSGGGGAEPVPLEGGLGERPGLAEAVVGRLVEPGVERGRPSACPTAKPAAARPTEVPTAGAVRESATTTCRGSWSWPRVRAAGPREPPAIGLAEKVSSRLVSLLGPAASSAPIRPSSAAIPSLANALRTALDRLTCSLPGSASSSVATVRTATFSACVQSAAISRWSGLVSS